MKAKKQYLISLLIAGAVLAVFSPAVNAQPLNSPVTYKVGIFAPLYLDSMFNGTDYKHGKSIPRAFMPGIDFVQGAMVALDSMQLEGGNIDATIYDSKSYSKNIGWLIKNKKLDSLNLIIGSVKDFEYKQLADFAVVKNIPFISATYPNDGGITANPYTVIMNSTLKAHCEAIYSYLLQNHGTDKLYLITKRGTQEDKVAGYFKMINEPDGKPLLNIEPVMYDSNFSAVTLTSLLDSNRNSVIIGGSLDETIAGNIARACNEAYKTNTQITLIGMPTWDGFSALKKKGEFETFPIYYTTPYFNNKWDSYSKMLISGYNKRYKNKTPSDMAFRGFESTYMFTKLLTRFPNDLVNHLNDRIFKVFCEYNFKPVTPKKNFTVPDYYENKHLYFVKLLNGTASKAW